MPLLVDNNIRRRSSSIELVHYGVKVEVSIDKDPTEMDNIGDKDVLDIFGGVHEKGNKPEEGGSVQIEELWFGVYSLVRTLLLLFSHISKRQY